MVPTTDVGHVPSVYSFLLPIYLCSKNILHGPRQIMRLTDLSIAQDAGLKRVLTEHEGDREQIHPLIAEVYSMKANIEDLTNSSVAQDTELARVRADHEDDREKTPMIVAEVDSLKADVERISRGMADRDKWRETLETEVSIEKSKVATLEARMESLEQQDQESSEKIGVLEAEVSDYGRCPMI